MARVSRHRYKLGGYIHLGSMGLALRFAWLFSLPSPCCFCCRLPTCFAFCLLSALLNSLMFAWLLVFTYALSVALLFDLPLACLFALFFALLLDLRLALRFAQRFALLDALL